MANRAHPHAEGFHGAMGPLFNFIVAFVIVCVYVIIVGALGYRTIQLLSVKSEGWD